MDSGKAKLGMIASSAIAALFVSTSLMADDHAKTGTAPAATADTKGECHGVNACKGKGECGGKGNSCKGTNACKGKGWLTMTEKDCKAKKGTFKAEKKEG